MLAGDQGGADEAVASWHCVNRLCSSGVESANLSSEDAATAWRMRRGIIGPETSISFMIGQGLHIATFLTPSRG